ncbi:recombinase family protein [Enterocloster lavalensis]|uniref:recombinase family protein n=1 Tax=Enterocloster lavalensis TaxID=460384 RepID=UPI0034A5BD2A
MNQILNHPDWVFAGIFYDFGKSGLRKRGRTGLEKILKQAQAGEVDYILTKSVSRVSRDTLEILNIVRYLKERGISMYFENEKQDSMNPEVEAYITLAGAVAQEESRNMGENMQWTVTRKFEQGIFANYKAFMGYRCVNGELEIVPEQAEVVKNIFDLYLAGNTFAQIKRELEKQKIKTATGKEIWDVTSIQKMLKNEKYKGDALLQKTFTEDYLHGIRKKNTGQRAKYYVKGSHPEIISPEIFDKVQEEMFQRARLIVDENGKQVNSGNRYSSKYLISNLLVCGNCGAGFRRRTERGKTVWRCGTRMEKGKDGCGHSPTLQDQWVKDILGEKVCDGAYDENIVRKKVKRIDIYKNQIIICLREGDEYYICQLLPS